MAFEQPEEFSLETVQPDGKGGLFLVSADKVLHRDAKGKVTPHVDVGSRSGAVCIGEDGTLWLGDTSRVHMVSKDRRVSTVARDFGNIYGLALDEKDRLHVSDWENGTVARIDGKERKVIVRGLQHPSGLAFDAEGNLYVKESGRQHNVDMRVQRIAPDGTMKLHARVPTISRWDR